MSSKRREDARASGAASAGAVSDTGTPPRPEASRPARGSRFSSIARSVSWGFWWRRLVRWLVVDALVVLTVVVALLGVYARELPAGTFSWWVFPAPGTTLTLTDTPVPAGLSSIELLITPAPDPAQSQTFPLGADLTALWPCGLALLAVELASLEGAFSDTRRIRRQLQPLNDLALRAEELASAQVVDADKMETLEQAIERASVDSPQVTTGDDDLASIEVALNSLLRQMQEAKLQQMRFVSDASHELRTPIAVIQGYVNMLDRWGKNDPEVLDESIAALKSEGEHMQELVEQLLFLARGDSGRNALSRERVNLAALVAEVWEESAMIDPDHAYELGFDEDAARGDARYVVTGDAGMLKQSMRVLTQNAAKYSATGTAIRLEVGAGPGEAWFAVRDEGVGMSAEDARHAFERFWRSESARGGSAGGSGLGLSIAKWIVDAHGGSIDVVSREGVGTRFTVRLPR